MTLTSCWIRSDGQYNRHDSNISGFGLAPAAPSRIRRSGESRPWASPDFASIPSGMHPSNRAVPACQVSVQWAFRTAGRGIRRLHFPATCKRSFSPWYHRGVLSPALHCPAGRMISPCSRTSPASRQCAYTLRRRPAISEFLPADLVSSCIPPFKKSGPPSEERRPSNCAL